MEKIQEALKSRVSQILENLDATKAEEKDLLEKLSSKYNKEFTATELLEIVNS